MREPNLLVISNKLRTIMLREHLKTEFMKWSCEVFPNFNFKKRR